VLVFVDEVRARADERFVHVECLGERATSASVFDLPTTIWGPEQCSASKSWEAAVVIVREIVRVEGEWIDPGRQFRIVKNAAEAQFLAARRKNGLTKICSNMTFFPYGVSGSQRL